MRWRATATSVNANATRSTPPIGMVRVCAAELDGSARRHSNAPPNAGLRAARILLLIKAAAGAKVTMGASGAIAGLYAATDSQSWVWTQPTGAIVPAPGTTLTLPVVVDDAAATTLADAGVNALRSISGVNQAWGARTLADLTAPRAYVGSSRTDLMLRTSIVESRQWVVFEPDDQTLWSTVTNSLTVFLTSIWHDRGICGATAADAFDVVCDISNNPPQLIEAGQLAVDVTLTLAPPDATLVQGYTFLVDASSS